MEAFFLRLFLLLSVLVLCVEKVEGEWRVIGAGLGRTGTDSMKKALGMLGFGEIYHMKDLLRGHECTLNHMDDVWAPLADGNYSHQLLKEKLSCFEGGLDYPVSSFFRELMEIYPNAKVLLTVRSPRRWAASARATICPAATYRGADFNMSTHHNVPWHIRVLRFFLPQAPGTEGNRYKNMMSAVVAKIECPYQHFKNEQKKRLQWSEAENISFESVMTQEMVANMSCRPGRSIRAYCHSNKEMVELFEAWNFYVKSIVPTERLVVFEIGKDGWDKLYRAFNITTPSTGAHDDQNRATSFPFINTTGDYYNMMLGQRFLACLIVITLCLGSTLLIVLVWHFCFRKIGYIWSRSNSLHCDDQMDHPKYD